MHYLQIDTGVLHPTTQSDPDSQTVRSSGRNSASGYNATPSLHQSTGSATGTADVRSGRFALPVAGCPKHHTPPFAAGCRINPFVLVGCQSDPYGNTLNTASRLYDSGTHAPGGRSCPGRCRYRCRCLCSCTPAPVSSRPR